MTEKKIPKLKNKQKGKMCNQHHFSVCEMELARFVQVAGPVGWLVFYDTLIIEGKKINPDIYTN